MRVLAGDIGGTNTRLAIWEPGSPQPLVTETYPSSVATSLEDVTDTFLATARERLGVDPGAPVATGACLGVAGPVEGHQCRATNLPWVVDARDLGRRTGIERFALVNDFVAMANSVPELRADDLAVFGGTPGGRRATSRSPWSGRAPVWGSGSCSGRRAAPATK